MGALEKKLYILHGWTTDTSRWQPFLDALKQENIIPIFLPIPGLTAPLEHPWTLSDFVEWLYKTVKDEPKVSILGHSNGGRIALAFALKYPEEVGQLFLVDSAGVYHDDMLTNVKRNVFKAIAKVGKKVTGSSSARGFLYKLAQEADYKDATPVQQETMKNLISIDLLPKLRDIKTETFIIWGKEDQITPYSDALSMKNELPNSVLFPIKDARHSPQFTHVSEVVHIIKENID